MTPPPLQAPKRDYTAQLDSAIAQIQREAALQQAYQAQGQQGQPPPEPEPDPLSGELPGEGYLFARDPEARQATLVETTPEFARAALLRAIEACAMNVLPYGQETAKELAQASLAFSQAYLLLDPSVDQEGVPVEARANAEAAAKAAFERPVTKSGHPEPPRVKPNPAENAIAEEHKGQSEELRGARADRPRPQPRVGS